MRKRFSLFLLLVATQFTSLAATDFTVCSYNCGGLSNHYDYLRAVCMHKLVQERCNIEPETMDKLDKIERVALKILFSNNPEEQALAQDEWDRENYEEIFFTLTTPPDDPDSINALWNHRCENMITSHKVRPVVVFDPEVNDMVENQLRDLGRAEGSFDERLQEVRDVMVHRIFSHELKYDLIALQEADYLAESELFTENGYDVHFSQTNHSINGVAWKRDRFELVEVLGNIVGRGFAVKLRERESGEVIAIASGHITGCNPFHAGPDSAKGDRELSKIIACLEKAEADVRIIAMDSNVTATHPRLSLLKDAGYGLDYSRSLESTCTNPSLVLNTRIDWIAAQSDQPVTLVNIPVLGVGLNSPQTNISDHKPIAVKCLS